MKRIFLFLLISTFLAHGTAAGQTTQQRAKNTEAIGKYAICFREAAWRLVVLPEPISVITDTAFAVCEKRRRVVHNLLRASHPNRDIDHISMFIFLREVDMRRKFTAQFMRQRHSTVIGEALK